MAIAKKLHKDGAKVVISSRKNANVQKALSGFEDNVHGVACHVGKREDREKLIEETLERFGAIDILVSNAGTNPVFGPMMEVQSIFETFIVFVVHILFSALRMHGTKSLMSMSRPPFC